MRKFLSATMLATSLIVAGGAFTVPAFAEVVYNRGSAADPEIGRSAQDLDGLRSAISCATCSRAWSCRTQKANLIPGAAESWTVSDDGTVYTFKLRKDGVWSDGSPVTADDFVYSFRRLEDPATAAEYASMLYLVKNAEEVNTRKAQARGYGRQGDRRQHAGSDAEGADAVFPRDADPPGDLSGQQGLDRQARRRLDQAGQSRLQRRLSRWPSGFRTTTSSWSRTRNSRTPRTSRSTSSTTSRPRTARRR